MYFLFRCSKPDYWELSRLSRWHIENNAFNRALAGAIGSRRLGGTIELTVDHRVEIARQLQAAEIDTGGKGRKQPQASRFK